MKKLREIAEAAVSEMGPRPGPLTKSTSAHVSAALADAGAAWITRERTGSANKYRDWHLCRLFSKSLVDQVSAAWAEQKDEGPA